MLGANRREAESKANRVLEAFGIGEKSKRTCSFAFSTRPAPTSREAFTFDLPVEF
jgi:hypothetical protein